ncbi:MAG: glycosyltransferase [Chloroflexota bacterium]|nr:glycosyltransferase [Chloroflexota bacterium]
MDHDRAISERLFKSFWLAGFESATHINGAGTRLDMLATTQHDQQVDKDYRALAALGIRTVRDGIRWHLVDRGGSYDFSSLSPMVEAANRHGIQVIWSLCHFGWPDDLGVFGPHFVSRFARYCREVARFLRENSDGVPFFTPINEISFLAWAAGEVGYIYPFMRRRGPELKLQLVRAVLAGCDAIWEIDSRARFVHVDPVIHVMPPDGRFDLALPAALQRAAQFEAWDMLAGRVFPELGGAPHYLDIVGVNFYHGNQWEFPDRRFGWDVKPLDDRWVPLHRLLAEVYERYGRSLLIGETSHFGTGRADWLSFVTAEVQKALAAGIPLEGVCLYPILDRPDWDNPNHWHNSGLWDLHPDDQGRLQRILHHDYAQELKRVQRLLRSQEDERVTTAALSSLPRGVEGNGPLTGNPSLLVFSHLRWDFVYQRPQHLLSRLAEYRPVLFIEEPIFDEFMPPFWETWSPAPNVTVARLHLPMPACGFHDDQLPLFVAMLRQLLAREGFHSYIIWFYTPQALPLARSLTPQAVVYDCMDELSAFQHSPPELIAHEADLFRWADLVFTGGPSLYRSKRAHHPRVYCFPSSVDARHFGQACNGLMEAADQSPLPHPRLGYFGVIDERIDLELLAALAETHPEWQLVIVGPVAKIDPETLPRHSNIHYLGQRPYDQLPHYLVGWDLCLLPFARNDATRFISPTKTLEYMAAERLIVSTPIVDVVELYGEIVFLGDTSEAFIAACEYALACDDSERACRLSLMHDVVRNTSWDKTARAMNGLIKEVLPPDLLHQSEIGHVVSIRDAKSG